MTFFNLLLLPFSWLYGFILFIRNKCYDSGILKSKSYDLPIIVVGNLSVGGTGKTPMIEYLIRLLQDNYQVSTLSRGYKRQTTGYILADQKSTAKSLGDEPFQYFSKFKKIKVAVSEDRQTGIENLIQLADNIKVILLDDAFQHRKVKAGLNILLTTFEKPYTKDFVLPMGRLRESRAGAKRANIIVVTKCPKDLSLQRQKEIVKELKPLPHQQVFFTSINYDDFIYNHREKMILEKVSEPKLILAGIAKPQPFIDYVKNEMDELLIFRDHHDFTSKDILRIKKQAKDKMILTTEKDFMRLQQYFEDNLFYLPMTTVFLNKTNDFNKIIENYVRKNSRNG